MRFLSMLCALLALACGSCNSRFEQPTLGVGSVEAFNAQVLGVPSLSSSEDVTEVLGETHPIGVLSERKNATTTYSFTFRNWTSFPIYVCEGSESDFDKELMVELDAGSTTTLSGSVQYRTYTAKAYKPFINADSYPNFHYGSAYEGVLTWSDQMEGNTSVSFWEADYFIGFKNNLDEFQDMAYTNGGTTASTTFSGTLSYEDEAWLMADDAYQITFTPEHETILYDLVRYNVVLGEVDYTSYTILRHWAYSDTTIDLQMSDYGAFYGFEPSYNTFTTIYNNSSAQQYIHIQTIDNTSPLDTLAIASGDSHYLKLSQPYYIFIGGTGYNVGTYNGAGNLALNEQGIFQANQYQALYITDYGSLEATDLSDVFDVIRMAFASWASFFNIQIFGTFTLGTFVLMPLVVILIITMIRLIKK